MMDRSIPALSLRQPWAWAILHAGKLIENRKWATRYRGRIRIHAAKRYDDLGEIWIAGTGVEIPTGPAWERAMVGGAYVGEVTVVDCRPMMDLEYAAEEDRRWAFGPICWILKDPVVYAEPVPGRGYPGLYLPERFERGTRKCS